MVGICNSILVVVGICKSMMMGVVTCICIEEVKSEMEVEGICSSMGTS